MTSTDSKITRHRLAHNKGGINLYDEGNLVVTAFKDFMGKIAKKIVTA